MYVFHRDIPGQQWNVFKVRNGQEQYVCSFLKLLNAIAFCISSNLHKQKESV
jgi:hypothetical protein